jgi:poly(A) polymerase
LLKGLEDTDARVAANKPVTPTFLFAILFYGPVMARAARLQAEGQPQSHALFNACEEVVRAQQSRVSIPRRFTLPMREMFVLQPRFGRREGKKALMLLNHARFRAAYDLLLLRVEIGAEDPALAEWWTQVQLAPSQQRETMVKKDTATTTGGHTRRPRRRRRGRRRAAPHA